MPLPLLLPISSSNILLLTIKSYSQCSLMASSSSSSVAPAHSDSVSSLSLVQLPPPPTYKNDLQGLAQRCAIADPIYETINEGYQHSPKFRCTVKLDGMKFTSELTFMRRKAAEQEAARIALECFTKKIKEEGHSFVCENAILCKSILDEFAAKTQKQKPVFNTTQLEGVVPYFQSYLDFNGRTYTGGAAINKMDAEYSAAQAAVLSTLGLLRLIIFEVIKSKSKFYDVAKTKISQPVFSSGMSPIANTAHYSIVMDHKAAASTHPIETGLSSKKRRKMKYKANKKARMAAELPTPVGGVLVNQSQICRLHPRLVVNL